MAVSLVSTGVQFPDSTIQTTAATASPAIGATSVGSVIISPYGSFANLGYAANPSVSNTTAWTFLPPQPYSSGGTASFSGGSSYAPIYSSYYGGWLTVMPINNASSTAQNWICLSTNGVGWRPIMRAINQSFGGFDQGFLYSQQAPIAVDDSNGRIWTLAYDSAVYQYIAMYQTTIGSQASTWTQGSTLFNGSAYSQQPVVTGFTYVNMGGVTANSGIVVTGKAYQQGNQVLVIAAGATTATNRFSSGSPTSNNYGGGMVWSYSGLKAMTLTVNGQGGASVSTNVNQTWTSMTNLTNQPGTNQSGGMAMSSSYNVYSNSSTLYYSTTFASWTSSSPSLGTISGLVHNGTYWLLRTSQGLYYSSSATPTGWTATGFFPAGATTDNYPLALRQY